MIKRLFRDFEPYYIDVGKRLLLFTLVKFWKTLSVSGDGRYAASEPQGWKNTLVVREQEQNENKNMLAHSFLVNPVVHFSSKA